MASRILTLADAILARLQTGTYATAPTSYARVNAFALERAEVAAGERRVIVQPGPEEWTVADRGHESAEVSLDVGLVASLDAQRSEFDALMQLRDELLDRLRGARQLAGAQLLAVSVPVPWDQQAIGTLALFFGVMRCRYRYTLARS